MKYDSQISEIQKILPNAKNILVVLSREPSVDDLAAGLALFLSLEQAGKKAAIVTEGIIRVGHTNLFGVGQIQNTMPTASGGNLVITLGAVVAGGTVPALEKLDWHPDGNNLDLILHVLPGHKFEPTFITPKFEDGKFDLIFTIGVPALAQLGMIYSSHQDVFAGVPLVNIDNKPANGSFGQHNLLDPQASSISEMIISLLLGLQLPFEKDIATNILSGIFAATNNLQGTNTAADTFSAVAYALQVGGLKPTPFVQTPIPPGPVSAPTIPSSPGNIESFSVPPVVSSSPEERPVGEGVTSEEEIVTPGSDWLTPKIFKGGSIG